MSDDDQTRDEIEEVVNDEPVQEPVQEEDIKSLKTKSKAKAKATPKIKITKEPVEPSREVIEEKPEPVIKGEKPKNNDELKEMVNCPDCSLSMTRHTLKYIHNKDYCKGASQEEIK